MNKYTYLRKGSVVPYVPMIGKTVVNKTNFAILNILLDWIELILRVDLE